MATNDGRATTIGKYIARFRQEKPRPREERAATEEDFWWTQPRNHGLRSTSGGEVTASERRGVDAQADTEDAHAKTQTSATALDWEVELLSDLSASQATGSRVDGVASLASSASVPAWSELDSGEPSPVPVQSASAFSARDASVPRQRLGLVIDEPLVDDGFVVVDDAAEDEEMKALETSLEDPEIVIQRIRRRLGFQPPQQQQQRHHFQQEDEHAPQPSSAPAFSAYSPLRDGQLEMAELLLSSYDSASAPTSVERRSVEQLELTLDDHDCVEQASPDTKVETPSEIVGLSADEEEKSETHSEQRASHSEEPLPVDSEASKAGENEQTHVEAEGASDALKAEEKTDTTKAQETEMKAECESEDDDDGASEQAADNAHEAAASFSSTASDARDGAAAGASNSRRKLPPATDEKPSPRLPPLSPARSPMFRMALTPSASPAISPRMIGASRPPELTAETSKTLDSLLSLVVHSWGEDSFFGGSETSGDAVDSPTAAKTMINEDKESSTTENFEMVAQSDLQAVKTAYAEEEKQEKDDIGGLEDLHATDPIVQMLRQRISVFEEALVRLEASEDQDTHDKLNDVRAS